MIKVNNTEYYNGIVQNKRTINFTVDNLDKKQELTITLINKSLNKDTVLKDGKIVMDKFVKIEKLKIEKKFDEKKKKNSCKANGYSNF